MSFHLAHVLEVDAVWPHLKDGMERACKKAKCNRTMPELYQACRNGYYFLHYVRNEDGSKILGGAVSRILETSAGRTLEVIALCGTGLREWLHDAYTCDFIRDMNIVRIEAEGRRGLERLPGAHIVRQIYELDFRHGGK